VAVREFDGIDDNLRMDGSFGALNNGTLLITLLIVGRLVGTPSNNNDPAVSLDTSANAGLGSIYKGTAEELTWGSDNPGADSASATNAMTTSWSIWAITKAAGTVAPVAHYGTLASGSLTHAATATAVANSSGTAGARLFFGTFGASGFLNYRLAVGALFNTALTNAQLDGVMTAKTTASIDALNPISLMEFTQTSVATAVTDLKSLATQAAITGTTAITGDDPPGWTFGLTAPAVPVGNRLKRWAY